MHDMFLVPFLRKINCKPEMGVFQKPKISWNFDFGQPLPQLRTLCGVKIVFGMLGTYQLEDYLFLEGRKCRAREVGRTTRGARQRCTHANYNQS